MKNVKLLPLACSLLLPFYLDARDLYVYDDGGTLVSTIKDVKEISFDETNMKVISLSNEATNVELKSFSFFTLNDPVSSISDNTIDIIVRMNGENLLVNANESIQKLEIYSVDGILLNEINPNTTECNYNMSEVQSGVYLIKVVIGENQLIQKIVKR